MSKKNGHHIHVPMREAARPPIDNAQCTIKPECNGCPYPRHGFICWCADGSCLKTNTTTEKGA